MGGVAQLTAAAELCENRTLVECSIRTRVAIARLFRMFEEEEREDSRGEAGGWRGDGGGWGASSLPVDAAPAPSGRPSTLLSQLVVPVSLGSPSTATIPVRARAAAARSAR